MPPFAGVKVLLDEERTIRFTNWTLARLENETGKSYFNHVRALTEGSHYSLIALTWGGLLHAEPRLTMEQAASRIDLSVPSQVEALGKAIGDSYKAVFGVSVTDEPTPKAGADAS